MMNVDMDKMNKIRGLTCEHSWHPIRAIGDHTICTCKKCGALKKFINSEISACSTFFK